jgi:hypothetical protein
MRVIGTLVGGVAVGLVLAACGSDESAFRAASHKEIELGCLGKARAVKASKQDLQRLCECVADGIVGAFDVETLRPLMSGARSPTAPEFARMNEVTADCRVPVR